MNENANTSEVTNIMLRYVTLRKDVNHLCRMIVCRVTLLRRASTLSKLCIRFLHETYYRQGQLISSVPDTEQFQSVKQSLVISRSVDRVITQSCAAKALNFCYIHDQKVCVFSRCYKTRLDG